MKFIEDKNKLLKCIQTVQSIVGDKSVLPILSNMLIETTSNGLQFIGTDLKISICYKLSTNIIQHGAITIPARKLFDIIHELPDSKIEINVENQKMNILCDKIHFQIFGLAKDEFPKFPEILNIKGELKIKALTLKNLIKKIIFSVSTDDTRYILNGILVSFYSDVIKFFATDGHRLSFITYKNDSKLENISIIIPSKTLNEIIKVITENVKDENEDITILISDNKIEFDLENIKIVSSLVEGKFPNVEEIINRKYKLTVSIDTQVLFKAIKRISVVALDESNSIKLSFKNGLLVLNSKTLDLGEATEEIPIEYENKEINIILNSRYLLDAIKSIDVEKLYIDFNDSTSAIQIRTDSPSEGTHIIMPIRIS